VGQTDRQTPDSATETECSQSHAKCASLITVDYAVILGEIVLVIGEARDALSVCQ